MLSRGARAVHRLTAVAYFGFGALLFLAPAWSAERFPWTVTPFVAMTIGGWCIGVTCFSWIGGRRGPVGAVLPVLTFVWLFRLSEIVVLFGALVAVVRRSHIASVWLAVAANFLMAPTLFAALANLGSFDFANRPLGALYIGANALGLAVVAPYAWRNRAVV
jgi:hypothetical protein